MIIRDDFTRFSWICFLKEKKDAYKKFEEFLADIRGHGEVESIRSDNGGNLRGNISWKSVTAAVSDASVPLPIHPKRAEA